jgi:hypothetical protein
LHKAVNFQLKNPHGYGGSDNVKWGTIVGRGEERSPRGIAVMRGGGSRGEGLLSRYGTEFQSGRKMKGIGDGWGMVDELKLQGKVDGFHTGNPVCLRVTCQTKYIVGYPEVNLNIK